MGKFIQENSNLTKAFYVEIVSLKNLTPVDKIKEKVLIRVVYFLGKKKLIDNVRLKVD